jgi:hypothetical protein
MAFERSIVPQINDLRKLYSNFGLLLYYSTSIALTLCTGHLFCQEVVLGGVLQTSKTITVVKIESETTQKDQFKAAVGVAVKTVRSFLRSRR